MEHARVIVWPVLPPVIRVRAAVKPGMDFLGVRFPLSSVAEGHHRWFPSEPGRPQADRISRAFA